ncbi:hypothetical protein tb265_28010 [Gemmatimonadetes bacterium T265]|nr:hypothetical protein tb265_28010 [Gemmatimonadetes bacterium T265]
MGWHQYPFLNPGVVGGDRGGTVYGAGIVAVFLVTAWAASRPGTRGVSGGALRNRHSEKPRATPPVGSGMRPTPSSPQAPPAAEPGTVPGQAEPVPTTSPAPGTARTARELAGLRERRDELVEQLNGTHARRSELVGEMQSTDPGARGVLQQQMADLDRRVLQMETNVTNIDHRIATAPSALGVEAVQPRGFVLLGPDGPSPNAVPALLLLITILQVALLLRSRVRRPPASHADATTQDATARLARMEQAVDAIAIEVERVSEGQRFVTRLLSEQQAPSPRRPPAPARGHPTPT